MTNITARRPYNSIFADILVKLQVLQGLVTEGRLLKITEHILTL